LIDLADGVEIQVLGLIWGIMLKFLKFGDDTGMSLPHVRIHQNNTPPEREREREREREIER
jgi:hypothetical protein